MRSLHTLGVVISALFVLVLAAPVGAQTPPPANGGASPSTRAPATRAPAAPGQAPRAKAARPANDDVEIETALSDETIEIADLTALTVTITHPAGMVFEEVRRSDFPPGRVQVVGIEQTTRDLPGTVGQVTTVEATLQLFHVGRFYIAPVRIYFADAGGTRFYVESSQASLKVASVVLADLDEAELRPTGPPVALIESDPRPLWIGGGILGCLLLIGLGFYLAKRAKARANARPRPPAPTRAAWIVAGERLDALEGDTEKTRQEAYYELSEIMREYLGARFGFESLEMTTSELLERLNQVRFQDGVDREDLDAFLLDCDLVKFARYEASDDDYERALKRARRVVEETRTELPPQPISAPETARADVEENGDREDEEPAPDDPDAEWRPQVDPREVLDSQAVSSAPGEHERGWTMAASPAVLPKPEASEVLDSQAVSTAPGEHERGWTMAASPAVLPKPEASEVLDSQAVSTAPGEHERGWTMAASPAVMPTPEVSEVLDSQTVRTATGEHERGWTMAASPAVVPADAARVEATLADVVEGAPGERERGWTMAMTPAIEKKIQPSPNDDLGEVAADAPGERERGWTMASMEPVGQGASEVLDSETVISVAGRRERGWTMAGLEAIARGDDSGGATATGVSLGSGEIKLGEADEDQPAEDSAVAEPRRTMIMHAPVKARPADEDDEEEA